MFGIGHSKGFLNIKVIAMLLAMLCNISFVDNLLFYGRDVVALSKSAISQTPVVRDDNCGVDFTLKNDEKLDCTVSYCGKEGWRLQSEYDGEISDYGASQKLSYYLREDNRCETETVNVSTDEEKTVLTAEDKSSVRIEYKPFKITFFSPSGNESAVVTNIEIVDGNTIVRGKLKNQEAMWGAGEHFDNINQRGQHVEINAIDEWAQIKGNSYMPIPILTSSRGSGLFMNRFERMCIDVDSRIVPKNTWQFSVFDAPCDLFVYTTDEPKDVLYGYSLLTGFSPEPAEWTYGSIICRYYPDFSTVQGVLDMAENMEANDFPWDAVIVEGFDASNETELKKMSDAVHGMGKKLMVYSATGSSPFAAKQDESNMFVRRASDNSFWLVPANSDNSEDNPDGGTWRYYDITSDTVRDYIYNDIWGNAIENYGVNGAKVDFCELFPDTYELIFSDGKTNGAHHWYPVVYNTLLFNKLNENEDGGMTLSRGGSTGAQRYPWVWMGDQKREYKFIAAQLKGVLSSGISGVPFTTFDMAGYKDAGKNEAEVFSRAVEFTAFTGNIQTHGTVKRSYDFDESTKAIYRKFAKIHDALRPYLVEQGKISSKTGLPLVRHLALSYWQDSKVWDIEDEYMLGEKLLVAPILDGKTHRDIYLPEGEWTELWSGKKYSGGQTLHLYKASMDEIPVFINEPADSEAFENCKQQIINLYND